MRYGLLLSIAITLLACHQENRTEAREENKPNVLFIYVDDLRPELNIYGAGHIQSPNIDKLASQSSLFAKAYCNVPVCGASRASLLTGLRPAYNRFIDYKTSAEVEAPGIISLPEQFKNNGYTTVSLGKIFHNFRDYKHAWDTLWRPKRINYLTEENIKLSSVKGQRGWPFEMADVPDNVYKDGKTVEVAIAELRRLKDDGKPFFMGVGFYKPHLGFNAPKKYWDLYDPKELNVPKSGFRPSNAPEVAFHNSGELRKYYGIPLEGFVHDSIATKLVHGYYACVSYMDALVGSIVSELESLDLTDNTIIVLCSDHGYNLREHGMWNKHSNFETSLRVPLIVKVPGSNARHIDEIVENVDIYPTLCDIAGLSKPDHLEGNSMLPLINNPKAKSDGIAIAKWFDGITLVTDNYFYTEWISDQDSVYARMLYDHCTDPMEMNNLSKNPEFQSLVDSLSALQRLHRGEDFWVEVSREREPVRW
ncbi:MAG: sulfatase [Reichenbachiella sp.]